LGVIGSIPKESLSILSREPTVPSDAPSLLFWREDYVDINVLEENKEEREGVSEGTVGSLE
jgi:hypothetical protein